MPQTPSFDDLLTLIQDNSAALRSSVADAPDLRARVPTCPDWSLHDLVEHLTEVQRFWAAAVTAGPSEKPPTVAPADNTLPTELPTDLLARSTSATHELIAALRATGPAADCWTWWDDSDTPSTSGAVARHQVHEAAVHSVDAQLATGTALPIPASAALDGITEFIGVSYGTAGPWPHDPTRIGLRAEEGPSWLIDLTASGAHLIDDDHETSAELYGSASNLLLALHGRLPRTALHCTGDHAVLEHFLSWPTLD